ncbi:MAG: hypothetical protein ABIR54_00900 [Burkholderiaceae bacterium]
MNPPSTAREAMIAEAIGDVIVLLDRLEAVAPSMDATRQALVQARLELAIQVVAFEERMAAITENAKVQAVKHIARRTDEAARGLLDMQTRAMEEAARTLFRAEVAPALQQLVRPLQHLASRAGHPWACWLTHAATAALASAVTWALSAYLWGR